MARFRADFWIDAYRLQAEARGAMVYVVKRGDPHAGAIHIRLNLLNGTSELFVPALNFDDPDERVWMPAQEGGARPDDVVDAVLERQRDRDPDLWIIEVEARDGAHGLPLMDGKS